MSEWLMVPTSDHNPTNSDMGSQFNIQCKNLQVLSHDLYFYQSVRLKVFAPMKSGTNFAYKCLHPMKSGSNFIYKCLALRGMLQSSFTSVCTVPIPMTSGTNVVTI